MSLVLAHGVFDLLHLGHVRFLEEARQYGDRLVVSVTADAHVHKGPGQPFFTAQQRIEMLCALRCVDEAFIVNDPTGIPLIHWLRPTVYVKGADYQDTTDPVFHREREAVESGGGRVVCIPCEVKFSSTALLRKAGYVTTPNY